MQVPTKSGLFSGLVRARWRKQCFYRVYMTVVIGHFILDNGNPIYDNIRGSIKNRDESPSGFHLPILSSTPSSRRRAPSRAYRL